MPVTERTPEELRLAATAAKADAAAAAADMAAAETELTEVQAEADNRIADGLPTLITNAIKNNADAVALFRTLYPDQTTDTIRAVVRDASREASQVMMQVIRRLYG